MFGNIFRRKRLLEARLRGIQRSLEITYTSDLTQLEKQIQHEYENTLAQDEMLSYQKSRGKWVKYGDKNTSFFHSQTAIIWKNCIEGLLVGDTWCIDASIL